MKLRYRSRLKNGMIVVTIVALGLAFLDHSLKKRGRFWKIRNNLQQLLEEPTLETLVSLLKIYDVSDETGILSLIRHGKMYDGGYVVPLKAFQQAQVLMGYGVSDDISFEEEFSNQYQKESYGFDCGVKSIQIKNKLCHFIPECIGTDRFLYKDQHSSQKISSFSQQLKSFHLENKSIFIKMDIEGAEYTAFPDILNYVKNITGIVIEIHLDNGLKSYRQAIQLLSQLNQHFYLIHVHGNNCCGDGFTAKNLKNYMQKVFELTYIQKSLVQTATLAKDQTHPKALDMPNCRNQIEWAFEVLD